MRRMILAVLVAATLSGCVVAPTPYAYAPQPVYYAPAYTPFYGTIFIGGGHRRW